ncbi:hypothetical protein FRC03_010728 [Tulasnella sp. 419]|nr:hypothetical protein FRC03_010728 [Tulasnella sp. 419]
MARGPWDSQPTQLISLSTNIESNQQLLSKRLMSDHCDKEKRRHSDSSDLGDPATGGLAASGQPHKKMKPDAPGDTDMGINKGERETSFEDMNADHSAKL